MSVLECLDWVAVRRHYDERMKVHNGLVILHQQRSVIKFAHLALGIENPMGNYSAVEHGLGPKIISYNRDAEKQVFSLGEKFLELEKARDVPVLIRKANIKYLQIGVGSEVSCMLKPSVCWVANTRTIWTHLVIKHDDNVSKADDELQLYRDSSAESEMAYTYWAAVHAELDVALTRIAENGSRLAKDAHIVPGEITYLWADAIASALYEEHHGHSVR